MEAVLGNRESGIFRSYVSENISGQTTGSYGRAKNDEPACSPNVCANRCGRKGHSFEISTYNQDVIRPSVPIAGEGRVTVLDYIAEMSGRLTTHLLHETVDPKGHRDV